MAGTSIADLVRQVRTPLKDDPSTTPYDPYWSNQEILDHLNNGAKILWRGIVDLYDHHFTVVDDEHFFLSAGATRVYGVPETVHRITSLEPRTLGEDNPNPGLIFKPADWNSDRFTAARALPGGEPKQRVIYYTLMAAGGPVGAPVIRIAPTVTSGVLLTCTYVSTLATFTFNDRNPIPGESDAALIAYAVAHCRAKEREDGLPDPGWLGIFATERTDLLAKLDKRQDQQPDVVEGMFEGVEGWGYE